MNRYTKETLLDIKQELSTVKSKLDSLNPEDVDVPGGMKASEESLNYAKSQVANALMAISNII